LYEPHRITDGEGDGGELVCILLQMIRQLVVRNEVIRESNNPTKPHLLLTLVLLNELLVTTLHCTFSEAVLHPLHCRLLALTLEVVTDSSTVDGVDEADVEVKESFSSWWKGDEIGGLYRWMLWWHDEDELTSIEVGGWEVLRWPAGGG
jgi:hypothetical protein